LGAEKNFPRTKVRKKKERESIDQNTGWGSVNVSQNCSFWENGKKREKRISGNVGTEKKPEREKDAGGGGRM